MKMTPERIEQLRRRHLGAVGAQTDAISACISALPDALDDLGELQRQLASSESIRRAGGKALIEEIGGRTLITAQLEEARKALRECAAAIMEWGHGNDSLLEAAHRKACAALGETE